MLEMCDRREGNNSLGSPPSVIADAIATAIKANRPKARFVAGQYAGPLLLLRCLVSDRMFDWLIVRMVR